MTWEKINNPPKWAAEALDIKLGGNGNVVGRNIAHVKGKSFIYKVVVNEGILDGIFGKLHFNYYRELR
jgi:hypothetical protein